MLGIQSPRPAISSEPIYASAHTIYNSAVTSRSLQLAWPLVIAASILAPAAALAGARTIAVLEFRAGARGVPHITGALARRMGKVTSNRVIPPAEARRILGASVDADVARCEGDAPCIARIGRLLGCHEVLLVGISQLGDTILAFQRIEVATGRVVTRMADTLGHRRRVKDHKLDHYLRRLLPPSDFRRYGRIVIRTETQGDKVYVDDQFRGQTPLAPLRVAAPGRYSIRVKRPGHEAFVARLDVLPDATVEVTPTLSLRHQPTRWYQKWWVWAIIGTAVVGGTTAAVVGATSQQPDQVPAVVRLK